MKKALYLAAIAIVVVGLGGVPVQASDDKHGHEHGDGADHAMAKEGMVTVHGEILDMACYVAHEAKGPDHAACAKRCVKGGQPMGLLAEDGTVYMLYASHDDGAPFDAAKEFAGTSVEISGKAVSQVGMTWIEVHSVKSM